MTEIITFCGFRCDICPAYSKNIRNDEQKAEVIQKWKHYFNIEVPIEVLPCRGCRGPDHTIDKECPVRPCAISKSIHTCADCDQFKCKNAETRTDFLTNINFQYPSDEVPKDDYVKYIKCFDANPRLMQIRKKKEER